MAKRPNSRRNLDIAIERVAGRGPAFVQARTLMADAVVAQMLPDGAVKGGSALKLRSAMRAPASARTSIPHEPLASTST